MIDLIGLTNALTDITVNIRERDLENLGVKKGGVTEIRSVDKEKFYEIISEKKQEICPAGSPANTIFNASKLGLRTALIGNVGYDDAGNRYIEKLREEDIEPFFSRTKGKSGICYILVTPDGERTNIVDLGVSGNFNPNYEKLNSLETEIFHTSGYEVASNPNKAKEIIDYFKDRKTKISFDLAADSMIRQQRKNIEGIVEKTHILFATEEEAKELTGFSPLKSLKELSKICHAVALKRGSRGSIVRNMDEQHKIPIYLVKVVNTCGAGDAYASGFLFAYIRGFPLKECGYMGSYIASRVCGSEKPNLSPKVDI